MINLCKDDFYLILKHFNFSFRLGCYGYVLEGKKYSTQYVADIKGYRPVFTYDVIKVYPKSGDVR